MEIETSNCEVRAKKYVYVSKYKILIVEIIISVRLYHEIQLIFRSVIRAEMSRKCSQISQNFYKLYTVT